MKDKKNEISGKNKRTRRCVTRSQVSSGLETRGETGVQNIPLQRCEYFDTAYRQQEHKNLVVRTVRNQEHPMAQRAARFSNGTDQHWKNKTQQQKAQNNSQLKIQPVARSARKKVDRSLEAMKRKWVILHETKTP
ncbi:hypothetical protein Zmor_005410 [Zophobas morio]|uniref:Uncharacterized protein n=1 Tax=Zophobas morio TaxID=2755281 RepID=A0AA38MM82_9CUCU|nr:hypothetical protein Zmor_005409 [Zophobas morio]KAJ3660984.1 hypothetical protein Zmor_005410 [Zophobas morio]